MRLPIIRAHGNGTTSSDHGKWGFHAPNVTLRTLEHEAHNTNMVRFPAPHNRFSWVARAKSRIVGCHGPHEHHRRPDAIY
jgi:hypothetical protein